MAAAARQLGGVKCVELAIGREQQEFRGRLCKERRAERVVGLEGEAREIGRLAFHGAHPTLLRDHDRDRLTLDKRFLHRRDIVLRRLCEIGAALAERCLRAEFVADRCNLVADPLPLFVF